MRSAMWGGRPSSTPDTGAMALQRFGFIVKGAGYDSDRHTPTIVWPHQAKSRT